MVDTITGFLIIQIVTFLTLVIIGFAILYRESRNRRWADEDRQRHAVETKAAVTEVAEVLRKETTNAASALAATTRETAAELTDDLKETAKSEVVHVTERLNVQTQELARAIAESGKHANAAIEELNSRLLEQRYDLNTKELKEKRK